jgi:hypothetical protein
MLHHSDGYRRTSPVDVASLTGLHVSTASQHLSRLAKRGLLSVALLPAVPHLPWPWPVPRESGLADVERVPASQGLRSGCCGYRPVVDDRRAAQKSLQSQQGHP